MLHLFTALVLATSLTAPLHLAGTARREATKPYANYTVEARDARTGDSVAIVALDKEARFDLSVGAAGESYLLELRDKDQHLICVEGPFAFDKTDIAFGCRKKAIAFWLLAAAWAAGVVVLLAGSVASGAQ